MSLKRSPDRKLAGKHRRKGGGFRYSGRR